MSDYFTLLIVIGFFPLSFLLWQPAFRDSWAYPILAGGLAAFFFADAFANDMNTSPYPSLFFALLGTALTVKAIARRRLIDRSSR